MELLNISSVDEIVEFAPGIGFTASLALKHNPKSYTGVDADEDIVNLLKNKFKPYKYVCFKEHTELIRHANKLRLVKR